jgi:hypothetical protein
LLKNYLDRSDILSGQLDDVNGRIANLREKLVSGQEVDLSKRVMSHFEIGLQRSEQLRAARVNQEPLGLSIHRRQPAGGHRRASARFAASQACPI